MEWNGRRFFIFYTAKFLPFHIKNFPFHIPFHTKIFSMFHSFSFSLFSDIVIVNLRSCWTGFLLVDFFARLAFCGYPMVSTALGLGLGWVSPR